MIHTTRIVIASGRKVLTLQHKTEPDKFYVLRDRNGCSGPFNVNDGRFCLPHEYDGTGSHVTDTNDPTIGCVEPLCIS